MTLIYFILILGVTIFIHELGHFIFAKKAGVYIYEFSLGMGPKIFSFNRKNDETTYAIRLIPLGGFVQMAGEEITFDEEIPEERRMQSKTWLQRFLTITAGCVFNFIFALVLMFVVGIFYGSPELKPYIGQSLEGYPAFEAGIEEGDLILSINGEKMRTADDVLLKLELISKETSSSFKVQKADGNIETYQILPKKEMIEGEEQYKFGLTFTTKQNYGLRAAIEFTFVKFSSTVKSMAQVIGNLITGNLGLNKLAGPVGIYNIVGEGAKGGLANILLLTAFLSINVGFVNFIPFPAFDGGRLLFLIIEKIKGSKVNPKVENIIHSIGFALLMLLMLFITIQDITRL